MHDAYIGLGANLSNPPAQLRDALNALAVTPEIALVAQSSFYRSAPLGPTLQPDYCNAVCAVATTLTPIALFARLLEIERAAGRVRDGQRWGPRTLDLDLLHYEGVALQSPELRLPHPEIARRNFVLVPLAEIAPQLNVPGVGNVADGAEAIGRAGLIRWPD